MRIAFALPLLLLLPLLSACEVNVDQANDSASVQYDENLAEDTAATVSNEAQEIGGHISNDVQEAAGSVQEEVGSADVDVDVDAEGGAAENQ